ncbi:uncharacterized protein LOC129594368 [Paramacrobiotus metropolitanus]|uniref:uncharacterized protein LOC129594368 n=1 Tax=Paramacrobiotus metropolitanus TaxID=2943436 RepID=UPI002445C057|nr:uncharacterized protein LOC129594368 [Paramacrobiotus metropolitanus]
MSLLIQEAASSHRIHHTNTILGAVSNALTVHSRSRRSIYASQESLQAIDVGGPNSKARRMFSATADLITRIGVDHIIIGFLSILLQIIVDLIHHVFLVYECDLFGPHLVYSQLGIFFGIFYIVIGIVAVRIGQLTKGSPTEEMKKRFCTFHFFNVLNFLLSFLFLTASCFLMYTLVERYSYSGCTSFNWTLLNFMTTSYNLPIVLRMQPPVNVTESLNELTIGQKVEIDNAIMCAMIANGFHGLIAALEMLLTLVGCMCRIS